MNGPRETHVNIEIFFSNFKPEDKDKIVWKVDRWEKELIDDGYAPHVNVRFSANPSYVADAKTANPAMISKEDKE